MYGSRTATFILVIIIFLVLEVVCLDKVEIWGIKPDLLLIVLVFFSLQGNLKFALALGLGLGFLRGIFTIGPLGTSMFAFGLCGLAASRYAKFIYKEGIFVQLIMVFLLGLFAELVYYLISLPFLSLPNLVNSFRIVILPTGIYTVVFALPIFLLFQKIFLMKK